MRVKSEIKVVEADSAEKLTQLINEHLDEDWKILLSSYTVFAASTSMWSYTTLMTKERFIEEDVDQLLQEQHDAPSALSM